jgi:N-acetylglucosamine-6-phosphate deacetylase
MGYRAVVLISSVQDIHINGRHGAGYFDGRKHKHTAELSRQSSLVEFIPTHTLRPTEPQRWRLQSFQQRSCLN